MAGDRRLIAVTIFVVSCFLVGTKAHALGGLRYVTNMAAAGDFALVQNGTATPLLVSRGDWPGVIRAAGDLSEDVKRVTDQQPACFKMRLHAAG